MPELAIFQTSKDFHNKKNLIGLKVLKRSNKNRHGTSKFLNQSIFSLGAISEDEFLLEALRNKKTIQEFAPSSLAARDFKFLAEKVLSFEPLQQVEGGLEFFVERKKLDVYHHFF